MGKALLSLFGSFRILTIDLTKPFKKETVTSMMEACKNSSQRSPCCLTGWMHHHTLEGRKTKEQLQPSEGTLRARDVPVSISHQGLCPAREAGERCGQPMGNRETARQCSPWNMSWCYISFSWGTQIITQLIQHFPPENTTTWSVLPGELPGAARIRCIRESQGPCQLTGLYAAPIPTPCFASY